MRITASPNARVSCSVIAADGIHSLPQPYTRPGAFAPVRNSTLPHGPQRPPCSMPDPYEQWAAPAIILCWTDHAHRGQRPAALRRDTCTSSGPTDEDKVALDHPHGERGHRDPSMGSTKCAPQRSQFEPILKQPGAARSWSRSGIARSAPCKAVSSSRLYAAFQSHLAQATRMVARGSSRSR